MNPQTTPIAVRSDVAPRDAPSRWRRQFSVTRAGVLLIFVGHLLACVAVVALMPGGRPVTSAAFAGYRVLPLAVAAILIAAIVAPRRYALDSTVIAVLLGAWLNVAAMALATFPASGPRLAAGAIAAAGVLALALASGRSAKWQRSLVAAIVGAAVAAIPVRLLRSPPASTRPLDVAFEPAAAGGVERRTLRLGPTFSLDTTQAAVTIDAGRRYVQVEPLLSFTQRSPDGCWTIVAAKRDRVPPTRTLTATSREADAIDAGYVDDAAGGRVGESRLSVRRMDDRTAVIESTTRLDATVWSHLNAFAQLTVAGHRQLRVRFSPAPLVTIDVTHAGYPRGAPARFAYVDRDRVFRVVEASSAEKGPFRELARGPLDGPLAITLLDGDDAFLELRLDDWAAQASVEPSPAAGWNVPQNAVEFGLLGASPRSPATFFVTLAATSVGRGYASVGHAPGVYRNRIGVTVVGEPLRSSP